MEKLTEAALFKASAVVAALTALVVFAKKLFNTLHKIADLYELICDMHLAILRLTVMSGTMPLEERIKAGEKYTAAGGNGMVKHCYENLLTEYAEKND